MTIPSDRPVFEGDIATYWFDDGILVSLSKNTRRTVAAIAANVALVKEITGHKKVRLLIYLKNSPVPDKETRKFATEKVPEIYSAMAIISGAGLAALVMKMVFMLKPPPIPMKNFSNEKTAMKWLQKYR